MTTNGPDQLTNALAQAWVGGVAAWSQLMQNFVGTVIEGAFTETDVKVANQVTVNVPAQPQTVQLGVTQLKQSQGAAIVLPSRVGLSQSAVDSGKAAKVVVTASPVKAEHPPGVYVGHLFDVTKPAIPLGDMILMDITPPSA